MNSLPPNKPKLRCGRLRFFLSAILLLMAAPLVSAQLIILDLPDLLLEPNKPNQTFDLYADNGGSDFILTGLRIELMVGDGGPDAGGSISGPAIADVSVTSPGTLFAGNNIGEQGLGSILPQV